MSHHICRICGNPLDNTTYVAREMMFGYRDEFEYIECSRCDCLQISEIPENLGKYYPNTYYSFAERRTPPDPALKRFLKRQRNLWYLHRRSLVGRLVTSVLGPPQLPSWMKAAGLALDCRILDVGCGTGDLLLWLRDQGCSRLTGVDAYIDRDRFYSNGVRVFRAQLAELHETFDFVMLHHSLEHMEDPAAVFRALQSRTRAGGLVLIRIPVVPSFAWREYRTDWVQLDAPRHLFLHSRKSIEMLSGATGFAIESVEYDSTAFQFWGSEQYRRNIPLIDPRSVTGGGESVFTQEQLGEFARRATELNRTGAGDQACFLLRRLDDGHRAPAAPAVRD